MKSILLLASAWILTLNSLNAQMMPPPIDTTLGNTETAAKAAPWLKNLLLPTGAGGIGVLSGFSAQALISDSSRQYADRNGVMSYYASALYAQDLRNIRGKILQRAVFMKKIGVLAARDPALFAWGVLEPIKGTFNFTLLDSLIKICGEQGVPFIGTVIPFSDWASSCNTDKTGTCGNLFGSVGGADYFFINQGKVGPVCDTAAFFSFVQKLVERYDGDGVDDMPNLKAPITTWEFSNEPDGPCGGYGDDKPFMQGVTPTSKPSLYSRDHSIMYRAMKAACPRCVLANGGSLESFDVPFWNAVMDTLAPNKRLLDIANVHVNVGKSANPANWRWDADFYRYVNIFQTNITKQRANIPIWMTEWGFYSGSPTVGMMGRTMSLPSRMEEEQAAIYTKFYVWGKANNLAAYFYDLQGGSDNLTSAALIQTGASGGAMGGMSGAKARLVYHTLRLYEHKFRTADSARQFSFSTSGNLTLPSGHIRLFTKGSAADVMWGLTSLPMGIAGKKKVTDIYGNESMLDAAAISFPLTSNPIIVEDATATSVKETSMKAEQNLSEFMFILSLAPNPASEQTTVRFALATDGAVAIDVLTMLGTPVLTLPATTYNAGLHSIPLDVRSLPQGMYRVRCVVQHSSGEKKMFTTPLSVIR